MERANSDGGPAVGALVVSLDFELHWGVRDFVPLDAKERERLLAARAVIPRILDLFEEFSIHATWATVGILFARTREEFKEFRPKAAPQYRNSAFDPYREATGQNESEDPFHFAPSLIAEIASRPGQEIASHSFSHYYCLEEGATLEDFSADLDSAMALARHTGYELRSYVFPRNQVDPACIPVLRRAGIESYRDVEEVEAKRPRRFRQQRRWKNRLSRLLDSYWDVNGSQTSKWPEPSPPVCLRASRYFRPSNNALRSFEGLLIERIRKAMRRAAEQREMFHLWWHPEDFAGNPDANLRNLREVLQLFAHYRALHGMQSRSMVEAFIPIATDSKSVFANQQGRPLEHSK